MLQSARFSKRRTGSKKVLEAVQSVLSIYLDL